MEVLNLRQNNYVLVNVVHPERRIESDVALGSNEVDLWPESVTTLLVKFMEEHLPAVEQNQSNV